MTSEFDFKFGRKAHFKGSGPRGLAALRTMVGGLVVVMRVFLIFAFTSPTASNATTHIWSQVKSLLR